MFYKKSSLGRGSIEDEHEMRSRVPSSLPILDALAKIQENGARRKGSDENDNGASRSGKRKTNKLR